MKHKRYQIAVSITIFFWYLIKIPISFSYNLLASSFSSEEFISSCVHLYTRWKKSISRVLCAVRTIRLVLWLRELWQDFILGGCIQRPQLRWKVESRKTVVLLEQNQRVTGMTLAKTLAPNYLWKFEVDGICTFVCFQVLNHCTGFSKNIYLHRQVLLLCHYQND